MINKHIIFCLRKKKEKTNDEFFLEILVYFYNHEK